jgi:hypothetical protein
MDSRVDEHEHPDRRAHVPDSGPHAKHGSRMMVSLESAAPLALGNDDQGINDLVELAEVEPPAPECQSFIPQAAHVCPVRQTTIEHDLRIGSIPRAGRGVVADRISESTRAIDLAKRIHCRHQIARSNGGKSALQCPEHSNMGDQAIDSEENVVSNDQPKEGSSLRDGPWLVLATSVDAVEQGNRRKVYRSNGDRDERIERLIEEVIGNGEGCSQRARWRRRAEGAWLF